MAFDNIGKKLEKSSFNKYSIDDVFKKMKEIDNFDNNKDIESSVDTNKEEIRNEVIEKESPDTNHNSSFIDEYMNFTQKIKKKYGYKFLILLDEDEEKEFIELRSKAFHIPKEIVKKEIEKAINIRYNEIIGNNVEKTFNDETTDNTTFEKELSLDDEEIKKDIKVIDIEIKELLDFFNQNINNIKTTDEVSKIKEELSDINTLEMIDSLNDFIKIKDMKKNILNQLRELQDLALSKSKESQVL